MKILFLKLFFSFLLLPVLVFGQNSDDESLTLTGRLSTDSKIILNNYEQQQTVFSDELPGRKTPILSGILSAIVPGAGQIYNEDYWIAGIFLAAEAALITVGVIYDNKAEVQTASFEKYADQNWSVVKYAEWLNSKGANIEISNDLSLPPWKRIVSWSQLNDAEREYATPGSHTLPPYGEQQYYELIGKYHQYIPGWPGENIVQVPQIMLEYSVMRGQANDYYSVAKTAVIGIYINHLLSALEAVWGAARFNNDIALNVRVESVNFANRIELVPTLNFRYSF